MSNENTPVDPNTDDLDLFSASFFGQKEAQPEPASSEEDEVEQVEESDATDDTHSSEDDALASDNEDTTDEDEPKDEPEAPKQKKNRFQERIDELTAKAREAERRAEELALKLREQEQPKKNEPTAPVPQAEQVGPKPDDKNEDGTEKYPLGEFDPNYIRDLTKHTIAAEREAILRQEQEEKRQREIATQQAEIEANWKVKLDSAQERYPDLQEKGQQLVGTFSEIDQAYGEYLSNVIMGMEYGPDVLYYLANHVDEADKIVKSGATAATIALGRLEARFALADEEKSTPRPRVSQAPTPPVHVNKGSAVTKPSVPLDTDDLRAFEKEFFKKRR